MVRQKVERKKHSANEPWNYNCGVFRKYNPASVNLESLAKWLHLVGQVPVPV